MTGSAHQTDESETSYGTFETIDGDVVVYDRENPEAWIQSSYTVEVGARAVGATE